MSFERVGPSLYMWQDSALSDDRLAIWNDCSIPLLSSSDTMVTVISSVD
jgi:hypothetical protein